MNPRDLTDSRAVLQHTRSDGPGERPAPRSLPMPNAKSQSVLVFVVLGLAATLAHAELPRRMTAFGLAIGQTPEVVRSIIERRYPNCPILPSFYHESPGYPTGVTALFDVARGTLDTCQGAPEGKDLSDALTVTFAHPSVAAAQPAYQIDVERAFPDAALVQNGRIQYSFEKIRSELFRTYGRPLEVHRDRTVSSAADLEHSLSIGSNVRREDYRIRYLWATQGHVVEDMEHATCECGPRYVQASLEISRSPSTHPGNQYFVLSLHLVLRDAELGAQQDKWNAQWVR